MPNPSNIERPLLVIGAGRTASSYVLDRLHHGRKDFHAVIENSVYLDVTSALTEKWWCGDWKFVCDEGEKKRRITEYLRQAYLTLFPSDRPYWVMKCIWHLHKAETLSELFPGARYVHLVRDPRTNVASMMERIGWPLERACRSYIESNQAALQFAQLDGAYLRLRQEDFVDQPAATWDRLVEFSGAPKIEFETERYLNLSPSQENKTKEKRAGSRLAWGELPEGVRQMAEQLGYSED